MASTIQIDIQIVNIYQSGFIKANITIIILPQLITKRNILRLNLISASSDFLEGMSEHSRPKRGKIKSVEWIQFNKFNPIYSLGEKRTPRNIEMNKLIIAQINLK